MLSAKYIVGNWKMHGSLPENAALLNALRAGVCSEDRVAVCVPFPYLSQTEQMLAGSCIRWGAQNVSKHTNGAMTGEVSASMLQDFGCHCVIVGHSERRAYHHESDAQVAQKAQTAATAGLQPIVCVGETLDERERGETHAVVTRQLTAVLDTADTSLKTKMIVAYEPVWAIGTGRAANADNIGEVHALLRDLIHRAGNKDTQLLYGGSVKSANAKTLLHIANVDGALVGGASLNAEEFLTIIKTGRS
ncbi:MAG: triose-phosphate isomerase [Burkholderiales bacterium]|jgi:triosephosphate isomerase|nr:triose-phosphate isomerase [Burkholderiales bacterium]